MRMRLMLGPKFLISKSFSRAERQTMQSGVRQACPVLSSDCRLPALMRAGLRGMGCKSTSVFGVYTVGAEVDAVPPAYSETGSRLDPVSTAAVLDKDEFAFLERRSCGRFGGTIWIAV
ncbi:hypothetical protein ABW19_dt0200007 [Dactylella cylindrospora]|nr:hypothetical protein ABW19_dt0200007 [Dactylella cylindrospora]